jgi:hypothetical protein
MVAAKLPKARNNVQRKQEQNRTNGDCDCRQRNAQWRPAFIIVGRFFHTLQLNDLRVSPASASKENGRWILEKGTAGMLQLGFVTVAEMCNENVLVWADSAGRAIAA